MEMSEGEYEELLGGSPWKSADACDVWITRDHRVIAITAMADSHLMNTIRFLRRNQIKYQMAELSRMGRYIANAPDGAADACESEAFGIMKLDGDEYLMHRFQCFRSMMAEVHRRGLTL